MAVHNSEQAQHVTDISQLQRDSGQLRKVQEDARRTIALQLIWAYLALLFLGIAVPVGLYWLGPLPKPETLAAIKDLSAPITAGVSSLTGVLGFVLGYYFKSQETPSGG